MKLVDKFAPIKYKYLRENHGAFVTKELRKAIMKRSQLKNIYSRQKPPDSKSDYNKQRNSCTKLLCKTKLSYFQRLNPSSITDNKLFWKTVKPAFTDKVKAQEAITIIDEGNIISEDRKIANIFKNFFATAVEELNINRNLPCLSPVDNEMDPIMKACVKFQNHPSVLKMKEMHTPTSPFKFNYLSIEKMVHEINPIKSSKALPIDSLPVRILKGNSDLPVILYNNFNNCISSCEFPDQLKLADVSPDYKKGGRNDKTNYRPVSILPIISKIYERFMFLQISEYFENKLSQFQCGFQKGYNSQYCLIRMLERWNKNIDMRGSSGALLTDLSKAFDCLPHELLIAKLEAYGFSYNSLKLIFSYFTNRYQRVRINSQYSSWSEIICGAPQGSILGPLLFNIDMADLFECIDDADIANFADDNTPFAMEKDIDMVITKLEENSMKLFEWLETNMFKANPGKSHLILSSNDTTKASVINGIVVPNENQVELLGITFDNALSFDIHVTKLCKQASRKLQALSRISIYMDMEKRRTLMNSFFLSQYSYCPLIS